MGDTKDTRLMAHTTRAIRAQVEALASVERRTVSAMLETLIIEALGARATTKETNNG
jgi:hypothetical protein